MSTNTDTTDTSTDITAIQGIGPATADNLTALGYDTAHELAVAYLTDPDAAQEIKNAIRQTTAFHRSLVNDLTLTNEDLGVNPRTNNVDAVRGMVLLRMRDARKDGAFLVDDWHARDHIQRTDHTNAYNTTKVDGMTLTPGDVDWTKNYVSDGANQVCVGASAPSAITQFTMPKYDTADECFPDPRDCPDVNVSIESKLDGLTAFSNDNTTVLVDDDLLDVASVLLGVPPTENPEMVELASDSEPVRFDPDSTGLQSVHVAPRVED